MSIFVVILAQSAATSRAYAAKFNDAFDENVDLVGLGAANLGAGLTGTFVVNGSPTKTAMVDNAGGTSPARATHHGASRHHRAALPHRTRSATCPTPCSPPWSSSSASSSSTSRGCAGSCGARPVEFVVALAHRGSRSSSSASSRASSWRSSLSIIVHLRHSYRPYDRLLFPKDEGEWEDQGIDSGSQAADGLLVYRFGASLYYANASRFAAEVRDLVANTKGRVRWFCLAAGNIEDLDFSGSAVLRATVDELGKRGVTFVACAVQEPVLAELKRDGLLEIIGEEHLFHAPADVLRAYRALPPDTAA